MNQNGTNRLPHFEPKAPQRPAQAVGARGQAPTGINLQMPLHGQLAGLSLMLVEGPQPPDPGPVMIGTAETMLRTCAVRQAQPLFWLLEPEHLTLISWNGRIQRYRNERVQFTLPGSIIQEP